MWKPSVRAELHGEVGSGHCENVFSSVCSQPVGLVSRSQTDAVLAEQHGEVGSGHSENVFSSVCSRSVRLVSRSLPDVLQSMFL